MFTNGQDFPCLPTDISSIPKIQKDNKRKTKKLSTIISG